MLEIVSLNPVAYTPTVALGSFTGATRPLVRGQNMFLRGNSAPYLGVYLGSNDLGETIPTIALTGTIAFTAGSFALVGTGTAFLTELHIGQLIFAATEVLSVKSVTDDENAVLYRAPETTASGQTGELPAGLFAVNDKRGTAIWGNAHELDQGSILGVGQGDLRLDGAVLPGGGLTLERTPRLAFYDEATGDYDVFDLGMDVPAAPTVNVVAGGTRGMVAAEYSLRIAPARKRPKGKAYGNASDPTSFTLSAAGDRPEIDFPAMDTAHGQNAWRVYGTLSTVQQFNQPPINGPWYYIREVTDDDVSPAGGSFPLEWIDDEAKVNGLLTFDNDAPPECERIAFVEGFPCYVSTFGRPRAGNDAPAPGPVLSPAKRNNIEAAPSTKRSQTSPPEVIIGAVEEQGRVYLMTPNRLQMCVFGNDDKPAITRPFWHAGFSAPWGLCFADDMFYGWCGKPTRSRADSTTQPGDEDTTFGDDVGYLTDTFNGGYVFVQNYKREAVVLFIYSAAYKNDDGWWVSLALPWSEGLKSWYPPVVLSSATRDMAVTGAQLIGQRLFFLAGGRTDGGPVTIDTFEFDTLSGEEVPYDVAWALSDEGMPLRGKTVTSASVAGKFSDGASVGIFGERFTENTPDLTADTAASLTGALAITGSAGERRGTRWDFKAKNLAHWAGKIQGVFDGAGPPDRIDAFEVEVLVGDGARA